MSILRVMGIDLSAGEERDSGVCLLKNLDVRTLRVKTEDELVGLAKRFRPKLIAIDAPLSLPLGGEGKVLRPCDRELLRRGIRTLPTTFKAMKRLAERGMKLKARLEAEGFHVIEVFPGGAQDLLGLPRKHKDLAKLKKGLTQIGLKGIEDDATHDEVDAATAAYVGWLHLNGLTEPVGDGESGVIIMPLPYPTKFLQGVALYRRGLYWHARKAWEEIRKSAVEPHRSLLKGLIQVATALIQCDRGRWKEALSLLDRAQRHLAQCPRKIWGVDLIDFTTCVQTFSNEIRAVISGRKRKFNWKAKPRLVLEDAGTFVKEGLRRSKADLAER